MALSIRIRNLKRFMKTLIIFLDYETFFICVNPLPLKGSTMFSKLECSGELKEGDRIIRVEFSRFVACVLIWRLCHSGKGILN